MAHLLRMLPMLLVMGSIFFLSHQSGDRLSLPSFPGADKLAHALIYGLLAAAILRALPPRLRADQPGRAAAIVLAVCFGYGLTDEFHQSFVPGRDASLGDLLADVAGAAILCTVWLGKVRKAKP